MSRTLLASPGEPPEPPGGFEVGYITGDGAPLRVPLADAAMVRFAFREPFFVPAIVVWVAVAKGSKPPLLFTLKAYRRPGHRRPVQR